MLHDIAPHTFSNAYSPRAPRPDDCVFSFCKEGYFTSNGSFPRLRDYRQGTKVQYLFDFDGQAVHLSLDDTPPADSVLQPFRSLRALPQEQAFLGGVAQQLWAWRQKNRFCGACGAETVHSRTERALVCPVCGNTVYPRISPAVIVRIECGNKIFLAQGKHYGGNFYSLLAGYVEAGESFEQTVVREVFEEVGLRVSNVRYWGNQPWPFSESHMIGFTAEADETQPLCIAQDEIGDAQWFTRETLPRTAAGISIAGAMIAEWLDAQK